VNEYSIDALQTILETNPSSESLAPISRNNKERKHGVNSKHIITGHDQSCPSEKTPNTLRRKLQDKTRGQTEFGLVAFYDIRHAEKRCPYCERGKLDDSVDISCSAAVIPAYGID